MLSAFLDQLFSSGQVYLPTARPLLVAETAAIDRLKQEETQWRLDFPGTAPEFSLEAGYWAASLIYRAAQFFAARDLPAETIQADLGVPCPGGSESISNIYSVDLTFRYLPDLYRLAAARASADPLVSELQRLGDAWPLSSPGTPGSPTRVEKARHFVGYSGFVQLCVDRALAAQDYELLASQPQLLEAAKATCEVHFDDHRHRIEAMEQSIVGQAAQPD